MTALLQNRLAARSAAGTIVFAAEVSTIDGTPSVVKPRQHHP
jgi:hypothetical protein